MGRHRKNEQASEHFTKMIRNTMETPAWRALTTTAQALYPWIKLEWKGPSSNNNGAIRLPVRMAAERIGCNMKTAARGFHDLQAKGFLILHDYGRMGVEGKGTPPTYEITELPMPGNTVGVKLYLTWKSDDDFPVRVHSPVNPTGRNGSLTSESKNRIPSLKLVRGVPKNGMKT